VVAAPTRGDGLPTAVALPIELPVLEQTYQFSCAFQYFYSGIGAIMKSSIAHHNPHCSSIHQTEQPEISTAHRLI